VEKIKLSRNNALLGQTGMKETCLEKTGATKLKTATRFLQDNLNHAHQAENFFFITWQNVTLRLE